MPGWTLVDTHPTQGRTFQRPLDATDLRYIWLGLFNGTGDGVQHAELHLVDGSRDAHLFSTANIVRAWLSTKRRFPLLAATVQGPNGPLRLKETTNSETQGGESSTDDNGTGFTSQPHFVVREHDLSILRPREIVFGEVTDAEEAQRRVATIFHGPRLLSEDLLNRLYIFRETDSKRADVIHLVMLDAHCITDRVASQTLLRCFLDTLARGGDSDSEPAQPPLEDRLAMALPLVELEPLHLRSLSPAMRRWRMAAGAVIFQLRWAKLQGGHTLPCHATRSTPHVAARHGHAFTSLTPAQSTAVFANCRLHDITFGNAYHALAQVAMTRVLYRRYLRGEISEEEWAYRKRQPHITVGPVNLRLYLDKAWFDRGGGGELMSRIGVFCYQLPFMTLGAMAGRHQHREHDSEFGLSNGAPPFSDLLTFDRFLHRARLVKRQATAFFSHPLFYEIIVGASQLHAARARFDTLQWMKRVKAGDSNDMHGNEDEVLSVTDMPVVLAHGGSSLGNMDLISPSAYPLPPTHPLSPYSSVSHPSKAGYVTPLSPSPLQSTSEADTTPKIVVGYTQAHVHVRPSELFLGASSSGGQMSMFAYYDSNVYEEGTIREWLDEVRDAVLYYLGRLHPQQGHARERRGGGDGQPGIGEGVRAKL